MTKMIMLSRRTAIAAILSLCLLQDQCTAFVPSIQRTARLTTTTTTRMPTKHAFVTPTAPALLSPHALTSASTSSSSTSLQMGFQLPPGKEDKGLDPIFTTVLSLVGVVAFFASPLGGIFFAITNSLFILALLVPVTAVVGFQAWQYFNTITAPCPNCGAPVQVVKWTELEPSPTLCVNCGSVVQANAANDGIDFAGQGPGTVGDSDGASLLDMLFGGGMNSNNGGGGGVQQRRPGDDASVSGGPKSTEQRYKREATIIDVDVEKNDDDDNKPFQ
jgi:hypothetical protein